MQREAREHMQRRSALLQPTTQSKFPSHPCNPIRDRLFSIMAQSKTLAIRISRLRLFHRLLLFSVFLVLSGWVVFFRFVWQESYALPGSGDVSTAPFPLLLWRDYNPFSPPESSATVSSCAASMHPLVGEWVGSCEQFMGLNIVGQSVCASSPCVQKFAASYSAGGFVRRYMAGLSLSESSCSSVEPLTARGEVTIEASSPLKYMQQSAAKSAWFRGNPYSVTVDLLGCYNAWANATHYQEEGNYDADWRFADFGACPACGTRGALARPGVCTAFGESVVCSPEDGSFSYRCTATKFESISGTSVFAGKWRGWCEQKRALVISSDGRNLGYMCTTEPYRQEYTVIYDDEVTSFFTGPVLQAPIPVVTQLLSIPASRPSVDGLPLQKFARSAATVARGTWFSGEPWSISLADNQGCYEAWANSTHYEEMGNGFNVTGLQSSCPVCSQNGNPKGKCQSDGALTCANELFSYRCTARRAAPPCHTPSYISDYIFEHSPSSISVITVRAVASSTLTLAETFVAGWNSVILVISPAFLKGLQPYPSSAYPSTATLTSSISSSTLKFTSSSTSFGYAVTAGALVAAAGVPPTLEGVPWQYLGVQIDLAVSASRTSSSISDVVIKVSRWSPASPLSPSSRGTALGDVGFRGIRFSVSATVMNKSDAVYFSGVLLTLAEGFVLCCLCYAALFVATFFFYGVRRIRGVRDDDGGGVQTGDSLAPEADAESLRGGGHATVAIKDARQPGAGETATLQMNRSSTAGDVKFHDEKKESAVEATRTQAASGNDSTAQAKISGALPLANNQAAAPSSAAAAASDAQPSVQEIASSLRSTPQMSSSASSTAAIAAPVLAPVAASTKAAMLNDLENIVSATVLNTQSSSDGLAVSSTAAAPMIPSIDGATPSKKTSNVFKAERSKSVIVAASSSETAVATTAAAPLQAPASAVKSKVNITSKEAVSAAIDLFDASRYSTAPSTALSPAKPAPAPEMAAVSLPHPQELGIAASRPSNMTSPVPKLDLTKAIQEQAREMGVNLKEQQKHEAELRRQLLLKPPPPDSDDEAIVQPPAASSSAASGSDILGKAGHFFKNMSTPVTMFSSEPSASAAPMPASRAPAASNAPSSVQPKVANQTASLDSLLPPPPSVAPGSQDYQRKSLRVAAAADAKQVGGADKVLRPLTFAAPSKPPLEARGAKPDFLTPPPPQAPEPPPSAPPDASLMSSVESVMSKFGSPFTAMFSPAPAAPDRNGADTGSGGGVPDAAAASGSGGGGGIMDSVTSSFGSLFTNAPDRVARLFSPAAPEAPSQKLRPGSPAASDIGSAWDSSSVAGSQISGSASVTSQSLAGGRGSSASVPSAASSQASSSSKSSVARSVVSNAGAHPPPSCSIAATAASSPLRPIPPASNSFELASGDAIQWTNLNPKSGLYNLVQQLQLRSYLDEEQAQALKTMIRSSDPLLIGLYQSFEARGFTDFDDFSRPLQRIARRFVESNSKGGGEALRPSFSRK